MTTQMAAAARVPQTAPRRASRPGRMAAHCREDQSRSLRQRDRWSRGSESSGGTGADGEAFKSSRAMSSSRGVSQVLQADGIVHGVERSNASWVSSKGLDCAVRRRSYREKENAVLFSTKHRGKNSRASGSESSGRETCRPCDVPRACGAARPWRSRRKGRNSRRRCPWRRRGGACQWCCRRWRRF